ncbi:MAG: diaminopimelate epimerase [Myxococcaceae bacterium]|nr:diaminopimelate epimerase [Myxococcaceae bacterium]
MLEAFFKYHGLGNDFVVLDRRKTARDIDASVARVLCDRRRGIGADGVLVLLPSAADAAVARMVVHNADGSIAEMCGNGLRCVVKHLAEHTEGRLQSVTVETGAGVLVSQTAWSPRGVDEITVEMGAAKHGAPNELVDGHTGTFVDMGNPHFVLLDTPPEKAHVVGPHLEVHPRFPHRANIECCRHEADGSMVVTVWERGVGITQACGTGACASVVASALEGKSPFDRWVKVTLPGGPLEVKVQRDLAKVFLKGPATFVYEGALP